MTGCCLRNEGRLSVAFAANKLWSRSCYLARRPCSGLMPSSRLRLEDRLLPMGLASVARSPGDLCQYFQFPPPDSLFVRQVAKIFSNSPLNQSVHKKDRRLSCGTSCKVRSSLVLAVFSKSI